MRIIDRLYQYLEFHHISPHAFERACGVANGYFKKQLKGRGTIGSEIIEKIIGVYKDLSLNWLVTGKGKMVLPEQGKEQPGTLNEAAPSYELREQTTHLLKEKIIILEQSLADKEKIIRLLEARLKKKD